jgi:uncharacterized membrane protein
MRHKQSFTITRHEFSTEQFLIARLDTIRQLATRSPRAGLLGLYMLKEIKGRDLLRTLILSALSLGLLSLYFYVRGGFSATIFQGLLAIVIITAIFDTCWLNAKRTRLLSAPENPISPAEKRERQIKLGRRVSLLAGKVVIAGLTIQLLVKLWFLLHR